MNDLEDQKMLVNEQEALTKFIKGIVNKHDEFRLNTSQTRITFG